MVGVVVLGMVVMAAVLPPLFTAVDANKPEIQTSRRLENFCQTSKTHQLQIVSAIFDTAKMPFTPQQLSKVYRSVDNETRRNTVEKELRMQGEFTIQFICALGDASAVNPCRPFIGGRKRSVLIRPGGQGGCYRQCTLTATDRTGQGSRSGLFTITSNILSHNHSPVGENVVEYQNTHKNPCEAVYNTKGEGDGWKCRDVEYQETSYGDFQKVTIRLLLRQQSLIARLWLSLSGAASFDVSCYTLNNTRPHCQQKISSTRKTTTTTTPTTTAKQVQTGQTTSTDTLTNIINVVVPTGGIIILAIIISIAALLIKRRQKTSATTTTTLIINPGPGATSTTRETVSDPPPRGQDDPNHEYCSIAMPETPRTQRDMEKGRRKRTAYCHHKDDYEDWVLPVT